jgi:hypothetical protein
MVATIVNKATIKTRIRFNLTVSSLFMYNIGLLTPCHYRCPGCLAYKTLCHGIDRNRSAPWQGALGLGMKTSAVVLPGTFSLSVKLPFLCFSHEELENTSVKTTNAESHFLFFMI